MKSQPSVIRQNRRRNTAVSVSVSSLLCIATITFTRSTTTFTTTAFVIQNQQQTQSKSSITTSSRTCNTNTVIQMGKNSERAHIERHLEEMMGDDWREFRARLVARERADAAEITSVTSSTGTTNNNKGNNNKQQQSQSQSQNHQQSSVQNTNTDSTNNKSLNKQGQLSDLFAGAINSIFHANNDENKKKKVMTSESNLNSNTRSIFDGDTIGGVGSKSSKLRSSYFDYAASAFSSKTSSLTSSNNNFGVEDPFVSAQEIPCHIQTKQTQINKHRWAHDIPHVETGCVLIANEKLGGVFHQTVVLIVQHNDHIGSIGIVINRPYEGDLLKIASEKESKLDLSLKLAFTSSPVTYGGPVLTDEYSILHGFGEVDGSTKLCPGVYVGGSEELMTEVRYGRLDPTQTLFAKGHAAWTPKQLQREISKGVWYVAAASSDLILRYAGAPTTIDDNTHDLWADILSCMGGKHTDIASSYSSRGDVRLP